MESLIGGWFTFKAGLLGDISNLLFFSEIYRFVDRKIGEFQEDVLGRSMQLLGWTALSVLTLWIMFQGYRIVTGRSRDSMMGLVANTMRATLIVFAATTFSVIGGGKSGGLSAWLTTDVSNAITWLITGDNQGAASLIDESLGNMQVALTSIDQLDAGGSEVVQDAKTRNLWFTGLGIAGPAITGGAMLLLNKVAMALFIGLGPLFILCLLFDQTKQLFQRWLLYGIGTLFSLAVMSAMVAISLDAVLAVTEAFWAGSLLGANNEGLSSLALQQGGLGMLLTMLIISAPPMAANFFQGTLGNFVAFSQLGGSNGPIGSRPGEAGYRGPETGPTDGGPSQRANPSSVPYHPGLGPYRSNQAVERDVIRQGRSHS